MTLITRAGSGTALVVSAIAAQAGEIKMNGSAVRIAILAVIGLSGCAQELVKDEIWNKDETRVVIVEERDEGFVNPTLFGIAYRYKGSQTPCTWKAISVEEGKYLVSMESSGKTPPLSQEFEVQMTDLGKAVAQHVRVIP